jgi:ubiquinone/menaquinone biosynthesis C-methylase UbiE
MGWTKTTSPEWAEDYRQSFIKDPVGEYTDRSEKRPVLEALHLNPGNLVLDAGCGTGRFLRGLPKDVGFVGLDLAIEMLKIAQAEVGSGSYIVALVDRMPFQDGAFDDVISVRVLQHVRDQSACIHEMARVAKTGGKVVVLSLNSWTLHCLYKNMRMGFRQKLFNLPFLWLGRKSPFKRWAHPYDNYCSLPELRDMFREAGLDVVVEKGGTIGAPWLFNYFHLHRILGGYAGKILPKYFQFCERLEKRLERTALKYFMDKIIIEGIKK